MHCVLLIDFGSTYTKATAVDLEKEEVLAVSAALTTSGTDISEGLATAMEEMYKKTGISSYTEKFACSSAAGGLSMIVSGLVPELTAEAARKAAFNAGAKVLKTYSYRLTADDAKEIADANPDIILLTGGTDGGNSDVLLHNAYVVAGIQGCFYVLIAGNRCVSDEVFHLLKSAGKDAKICKNVMPELDSLHIEPTGNVIREVFLKRIIQAKGLTKIQSILNDILMPTPSAVLSAATFLSKGTASEKGIGELLVVDPGGATTDVHSIAAGNPSTGGIYLKGLPEPLAKRTVEGDLGVRSSILSLLDAAGIENIAGISLLNSDEIKHLAKKLKSRADAGNSENEKSKVEKLDHALACMCIRHAVARHAGILEDHWSPHGHLYIQTGKDLSAVLYVIGTGGPVINSINPAGTLKHALADPDEPLILKPRNATLLLDKKYIMSAMGLLCSKYPDIAVRIMKKELLQII